MDCSDSRWIDAEVAAIDNGGPAGPLGGEARCGDLDQLVALLVRVVAQPGLADAFNPAIAVNPATHEPTAPPRRRRPRDRGRLGHSGRGGTYAQNRGRPSRPLSCPWRLTRPPTDAGDHLRMCARTPSVALPSPNARPAPLPATALPAPVPPAPGLAMHAPDKGKWRVGINGAISHTSVKMGQVVALVRAMSGAARKLETRVVTHRQIAPPTPCPMSRLRRRLDMAAQLPSACARTAWVDP